MGDKVQALALVLHRLGYPTPVPSDLHQRPNFEFVADCFAWLCQRIDPEVVAPRDYGSEHKRASFLASLASQLHARVRLKVNLRRLYRASSSAAGELLALANALQEAAGSAAQDATAVAAAGTAAPATNHVAHLQRSRAEDRATLQALAAGVTSSGQQLLGALGVAPAITQQLDAALAAGGASGGGTAGLKAAAREAMGRVQQQVAALQRAVAELDQEQQSLEAKVEKRHVELDRMERRLDALHAIRPAQSEEVDRLEAELAELYRAYLHKFRNLEYLEGQLDRHNALQEAKAEEADKAMRKIQRQMREEEARVLAGSGDQNGDPNHLGLSLGPGLGSSDDSEADFAAFEPKALPRLGAGQAAASAAGQGALSDHLLLVPDDSSSSAAQSPTRVGSGRLSGAGAAAGRASGPGSLRPSSAGGGSRRPSSAAKRAGGGGAAADLLVVEDMQRLGLGERAASLATPGDNDF